MRRPFALLVRPVRLEPEAQERGPRAADDDAVGELRTACFRCGSARRPLLGAERQRVVAQRVERLENEHVGVEVDAAVLCTGSSASGLFQLPDVYAMRRAAAFAQRTAAAGCVAQSIATRRQGVEQSVPLSAPIIKHSIASAFELKPEHAGNGNA